MTSEERYQAFLTEYNQLTAKYGFQIAPASGEAEAMGANWLIRPGVTIEAIKGWQPPPVQPEEKKEVK